LLSLGAGSRQQRGQHHPELLSPEHHQVQRLLHHATGLEIKLNTFAIQETAITILYVYERQVF